MIQNSIETKIGEAFQPQHCSVRNESHLHSGPAAESHFNVTLVSEAFSGLSLVKRHQKVYKLLAEELAGGVHALALHLYTAQEWSDKQGIAPDSPNCLGGSKSNATVATQAPSAGAD